MRPKSLILLALALGCGLVASIGISQVMERRNAAEAPKVEMEEVLVAAALIKVNDPITPELVRMEKWPKEKIPVDAIRNLEEVEERRAGMPILEGDVIAEQRLLKGDYSASVSIPEGYRPVPVRVNDTTGTAGLVKPGDRVDVQWYVKRGAAEGIDETSMRTILHDAKVFAVDQFWQRASDSEETAVQARTVSLLLTPEQAAKINLATRLGELTLLLRSPDDTTITVGADSTTIDDLVGSEKAKRENEHKTAELEEKEQQIASLQQQLDDLAAKKAAGVAQLAAVEKPWRMIILRGSEPESVEFTAEGGLPKRSATPTAKEQTQDPADAPATLDADGESQATPIDADADPAMETEDAPTNDEAEDAANKAVAKDLLQFFDEGSPLEVDDIDFDAEN